MQTSNHISVKNDKCKNEPLPQKSKEKNTKPKKLSFLHYSANLDCHHISLYIYVCLYYGCYK